MSPQPGDRLPVPWQQHAACRNSHSDLFFPTSHNQHTLAVARQYCRACPVAEACLEYAITTHAWEGIWGGTPPTDRRPVGVTSPPIPTRS